MQLPPSAEINPDAAEVASPSDLLAPANTQVLEIDSSRGELQLHQSPAELAPNRNSSDEIQMIEEPDLLNDKSVEALPSLPSRQSELPQRQELSMHSHSPNGLAPPVIQLNPFVGISTRKIPKSPRRIGPPIAEKRITIAQGNWNPVRQPD